jgi:hypothetical protein
MSTRKNRLNPNYLQMGTRESRLNPKNLQMGTNRKSLKSWKPPNEYQQKNLRNSKKNLKNPKTTQPPKKSGGGGRGINKQLCYKPTFWSENV